MEGTTEKFLKIIEETSTHRIEEVKVRVDNFIESELMYALILKLDGKEVKIRRYSHANYGLDDAKKLALEFKHNIDNKVGFLMITGIGDPLSEFKTHDLQEFTCIAYQVDGSWIFWGNHKTFSGVFNYLVWDKELAEIISKKIIEEDL